MTEEGFLLTDRIVLEPERRRMTGYARTRWWELELQGVVPRRRKLGANRVGWLLSELLEWLRSLPAVGVDAAPKNCHVATVCPVSVPVEPAG